MSSVAGLAILQVLASVFGSPTRRILNGATSGHGEVWLIWLAIDSVNDMDSHPQYLSIRFGDATPRERLLHFVDELRDLTSEFLDLILGSLS